MNALWVAVDERHDRIDWRRTIDDVTPLVARSTPLIVATKVGAVEASNSGSMWTWILGIGAMVAIGAVIVSKSGDGDPPSTPSEKKKSREDDPAVQAAADRYNAARERRIESEKRALKEEDKYDRMKHEKAPRLGRGYGGDYAYNQNKRWEEEHDAKLAAAKERSANAKRVVEVRAAIEDERRKRFLTAAGIGTGK